MFHRILLYSLLLSLGTTVMGQVKNLPTFPQPAPPPANPATLGAVRQLHSFSSGSESTAFPHLSTLELRRNAEPEAVAYGANKLPISVRLSHPFDETSVETGVLECLRKTQKLLGLKAPALEFEITDSNWDALGFYHIKIQQMHQGLPVYGAQWILHARNRRFFLMTGRGYPTPVIDQLHPAISPEKARALVMHDLKGKTAVIDHYQYPQWAKRPEEKTELVVYHLEKNGSRETLAWHLEVFPNLVEKYVYFIDANSGNILNQYKGHCSFMRELEPNCQVERPASQPTYPVGGEVTNTLLGDGPAVGNAPDLFGINRTLNTYEKSSVFYLIDASRDIHNAAQSSFPHDPSGVIWTVDARNSSPQSSNFNAFHFTSGNNNSWNDRKSVSAHYNGGKAFEYFRSTHNRRSINNRAGNILSFVNVAEPGGAGMDNAFWNGAAIYYGNGNTFFSSPLAKALDIAGHEMTHGVIQTTANLDYQGESGAMNEAFADIFGVMMDRDDWKLGEDAANPAFFPTGCNRDLSNPHNGGNDLNDPGWQPAHYDERYQGTSDNGGVHINSGIVNFAFYKFASNPTIGKDKAERVFYRALTQYLVKSSEFVDLRIALVQSTKDLFGANPPELPVLNAALDAVGIPGGAGGNYQTDLPENPGDAYLVFTDLNDGAFYLANSNGNILANPWIDLEPLSKMSMTDDGSYGIFIDQNNRMIGVDLVANSFGSIHNQSIWKNAAISKDGKRMAAITRDNDNLVYIYNFENPGWETMELYNPTYTAGVSTGEVLTADILEWDYSGEWIMYDALNEIRTNFGNLRYWDIGFLNAWDASRNRFGPGTVQKIFSGIPEDMSIGNPSFSKRSPYIITFDFIDDIEGTSDIMTVNLETGDISDPPIFRNIVVGSPNFTPSDQAITFDAEDNQGNNILAGIQISSDKLSPVNNPFSLISNGKKGVWFSDGTRPLTSTVEIADNLLVFRPNPVRYAFTIEWPEGITENDLRIRILHPSGPLVSEQKCQNPDSEILVGSLPSGSYLVEIWNSRGKKMGTGRFIKL